MPETYSLGVTGRRDSFKTAVQTVKVPDSAARPGQFAYHTRLGDQILCQNPDGSQSYYTIDAERSRVNDLVFRKV
jgi:hypothetical protein